MFPMNTLSRDYEDDIDKLDNVQDVNYLQQSYDNMVAMKDKINVPICEEVQNIAEPYYFFDSLLNDEEKQTKILLPVDTHYYDEEDYQYHRQNTYPHAHHPLKSMEPRILMEIKKRIKASKRAEEKAAKAGVASCVPELLASTSDTRVLINTTTRISGPVLTLVKESVSCELPLHDRKKKKRKRRRSKKQEPFKPTLCKLSEESSSPLHSTVIDECSNKRDNGLLLAELCDAIKSLDISQSTDFLKNQPSFTRLSFLNNITHMELVNTSLDDTCLNSLPFFDNVDNLDNIITNQSFLDLTELGDHLSNIVDLDDTCDETDLITNQSCSYVLNQDNSLDGNQSPLCTGVCSYFFNQNHRHKTHYHPHHHHSHKEHFDKRDLEQRTFSGQDMRSLWQTKESEKVLCGYDSVAGDTIVDDIKSHRCDEIPALNNARIRNRYFHPDLL